MWMLYEVIVKEERVLAASSKMTILDSLNKD